MAPAAGGATFFPLQRALPGDASVELGVGDLLAFPHGLLHRALPVEVGQKLLLRTNVVVGPALG